MENLLRLSLLAALFLAVPVSGNDDLKAERARPVKAKIEYGSLVEILDANRLRVAISGKIETVRLLGTYAPSTGNNQPPQCFSREAIAFLRRMLTSRTLALEIDAVTAAEGAQELLRYVYIQPANRDLSAELLRNGMAVVQDGIAFRRRNEFLRFQREAQSLGVGLWVACTMEDRSTASPFGSYRLKEDALEAIRALEQRTERQGGSQPSVAPRTRSGCCMICRTGKACGNGCIAPGRTCRQPSGCACDG